MTSRRGKSTGFWQKEERKRREAGRGGKKGEGVTFRTNGTMRHHTGYGKKVQCTETTGEIAGSCQQRTECDETGSGRAKDARVWSIVRLVRSVSLTRSALDPGV